MHCRLVLLDEAGETEWILAKLLVKNGFGSRDVLDWGAADALIVVRNCLKQDLQDL